MLFLEMWAQDACDLTIINCQTNLSILVWYLESLSFIVCTHVGLKCEIKTCFKAMHYVLHAFSFKRSVSYPILRKWLAIWKKKFTCGDHGKNKIEAWISQFLTNKIATWISYPKCVVYTFYTKAKVGLLLLCEWKWLTWLHTK